MKQEWWSRFILGGVLALVGLFAGATWYSQGSMVTVRARMPEQGGWVPGDLIADAGEPLRIRLISEDVTHGFAIGQMDMQPIDLYPGEVHETTLVFDQPGKYTYYCTRWCGPNHWRMRGTIEVRGKSSKPDENEHIPLYVELDLDIDAPHPAQVIPQSRPSTQGITTLSELDAEKYGSQSFYRSHSPTEAWLKLRADPKLENLGDQSLWSVVATIWQANTTPEQLAIGKDLYAANCASCHGEGGAGNGVFAGLDEYDDASMGLAFEVNNLMKPVDFTDPTNMLGASPALLHGKIVRGGMGTGMPYWGPIFTDEQIWTIVSYLWTFQFNYTMEVKP